MSRRLRLDAELVRRGLARSRDDAAHLINDGLVTVGGQRAKKPASQVSTDVAIVVRKEAGHRWVSRGAHKLISALDVFEPEGLTVRDKRCLDAGASTGGFTEVLLHRGAREVLAVDVGYGQLAWSLQSDERVTVFDRTNIRHVDITTIGSPVDLVVSDLSFISLTLVMAPLSKLVADGGDMVMMIKPQFEVGKEALGKNGVVRDPDLHSQSIADVCDAAWSQGWGVRGLAPSMLPGPAGNVEYFCWLRQDASAVQSEAIDEAIARGPAGGQR